MQKYNKNQTIISCGMLLAANRKKILLPNDDRTSIFYRNTLIRVGRLGDNNEIVFIGQPQERTVPPARNQVSTGALSN